AGEPDSARDARIAFLIEVERADRDRTNHVRSLRAAAVEIVVRDVRRLRGVSADDAHRDVQLAAALEAPLELRRAEWQIAIKLVRVANPDFVAVRASRDKRVLSLFYVARGQHFHFATDVANDDDSRARRGFEAGAIRGRPLDDQRALVARGDLALGLMRWVVL